MGRPLFTHQLEARSLGDDGYHIIWRNSRELELWRAYRETENAHKQFIRLHTLDSQDLLEVFKFMRDIVAGTIDPELINPEL
jgi:hypothetical protein